MGVSLIRERLKEIGCDLVPPERSTPEYLRTFVASEIDKWAGAIKASGDSDRLKELTLGRRAASLRR
jgi:hypothetical protein